MELERANATCLHWFLESRAHPRDTSIRRAYGASCGKLAHETARVFSERFAGAVGALTRQQLKDALYHHAAACRVAAWWSNGWVPSTTSKDFYEALLATTSQGAARPDEYARVVACISSWSE